MTTDGSAGGSSYIRWGRTSCPNTPGTELLYEGLAGGPLNSDRGGGSNYLCLTNNPVVLEVIEGIQTSARSRVFGSEYHTVNEISPGVFGNNYLDLNVPCAACYTPLRGDKIMIPGTTDCPSSWTREYYGYLMSEGLANYRMSYECVDVNAETISGTQENTNGVLFFLTEIHCEGFMCPPYVAGNELACVVCTK